MSPAALSLRTTGVAVAPPAVPPAAPRRDLSILHLITRLERGGSSECTLLQALGAAARGHTVCIASGPTPVPSPLLSRAGSAPRVRLLTLAGLCRELRPWSDLRTLLGLVRLLRRERFDIIHTHTSKAGALGRIAALLAGRRRTLLHQPHGHLFYGYYGALGTALLIGAERILAPLARTQIALSWRGVEEHLGRRVGRIDRFTAIPSGIDLRPFRTARTRRPSSRGRLGLPGDAFAIGTLCRLEPIKGVEDLLRGFLQAAADRPRLRLILAGDGPLRERLRDLARDSGLLQRVHVATGWVRPEEVLPALDLFVLASRNEGMGRALVEAMACGVPVAGSAVGGVPEVLEEGRAGLLFPPAEPAAIAAAIGRIADNPQLAAELGRRGRRRAIAFGAGRMNRVLLRLYDEVAS
jgi:glycosyltransferase involved in cell wall biosynthesis